MFLGNLAVNNELLYEDHPLSDPEAMNVNSIITITKPVPEHDLAKAIIYAKWLKVQGKGKQARKVWRWIKRQYNLYHTDSDVSGLSRELSPLMLRRRSLFESGSVLTPQRRMEIMREHRRGSRGAPISTQLYDALEAKNPELYSIVLQQIGTRSVRGAIHKVLREYVGAGVITV